MHKTGGWIVLIAGFCAIGAALLATSLSVVDTTPGGRFSNPTGNLFGGITIAAILIIAGVIILNTRSRVPAILLLAFNAFLFYFGLPDGLVTICLAFATLGGLFALFRG